MHFGVPRNSAKCSSVIIRKRAKRAERACGETARRSLPLRPEGDVADVPPADVGILFLYKAVVAKELNLEMEIVIFVAIWHF